MNEWVGERVNKWVSEWMSEWMNEWVSEWVSEWGSEWVSEWVSEWMNGILYLQRVLVFSSFSVYQFYSYLYRSMGLIVRLFWIVDTLNTDQTLKKTRTKLIQSSAN